MRKIIYAVLLIPTMMFAQDDMPPPGLEDPVAADIDQINFILLITAIFLGLYFVYKKHNSRHVFSQRKKI